MRRDDEPFDDEDFAELFDDILDALGGDDPAFSEFEGPDGGDAPQSDNSVHFDVRDYEDGIKVIATLPAGISKDNLTVKCDGTTTVIGINDRTGTETHTVDLPAKVVPESATARYNNGILTTEYDRAGSDDDDVDISID